MRKIFYIGIIAFSLLILTLNIFLFFFNNSQISQSKTATKVLGKSSEKQREMEKEIAYWQEITSKYPDFRDAYLKLAILYAKNDNKNEALSYLEKVFELDPNYEEAIELKKTLEE